MNWPLVVVNDAGIRPAGKPDECFYCRRKVGQPHGPECVVVTRRVRVRYSVVIEIDVPHFWEPHDIEFHRNEGTWCADNCVDDIQECLKQRAEQGQCLCSDFKCEYIEDADATPRRDVRVCPAPQRPDQMEVN